MAESTEIQTLSKPRFVHLRVRSALSLLGSMITIKSLCKWTAENGFPAVAITDDNNMFGALELSETIAPMGVQPVVAITLHIYDPKNPDTAPTELALFAQNEIGYKNMMVLTTKGFLESPSGGTGVYLDDVLAHTEGLICTTGGGNGEVTHLCARGDIDGARNYLNKLSEAFPDRLYVELQRHGRETEDKGEEALVDLAYELDLPLVATNEARFIKRAQHKAHDALLCIAGSTYVSVDDRPKASPEQYMKTEEEMMDLFSDLPEAIENTCEIARRCAYRPAWRKPILPNFTGDDGDEGEELDRQAREGLKMRLSTGKLYAEESEYWERLDFELGIIRHMGFPGYFLIVSDFIKWAKEHDIPVGPGRGSGAGSLVAWVLTITDLDPLRFGLLFERFLNPERVSMPDFDVDFCQDRRQEVIEYTKRKYGEDRVAMIITYGTLQAKAVIRDVGRVHQLPFGQVDKLSKLIPFNPANPPTLQEAIDGEPKFKQEMRDNEDVRNLVETALELEGLYRNAGTHAAGVVIGDRPLVELAPLYKDPKSDIPATQFNMKWAEHNGLVKFDFLGLKTLTVIQRALKFVESEGKALTEKWHTFDDEEAYKLLSSGETLGVFQLESTGMRDTLRKVKPDCIEDIIALISLYRPGPMKNIDTYVARKEGREEIDYLHDDLKPVLEETYGVIVYQEQVMRIAQILAGYSLGEADLLRRAMGKKKPEEMLKQKVRFLEGAAEKGVTKERAEFIFELVNEFAGYGFNKSHAAAYAVIAYQTAYLKAKHPVEFLAGSMSLDLTNTEKLAAFFQETKRLKIPVVTPDIMACNADFDVRDQKIYYALGAVKGVGKEAMLDVERARNEKPFENLFDFAERVDPRQINRRVYQALSKCGGFDQLEKNRSRAFESSELLAAMSNTANKERNSNQNSLFGDEPPMRPKLPKAAPWSSEKILENELSSVGFYLSGHPLDDILEGPARERIVLSSQMMELGRERAALEMIGVVKIRMEKPSMSGGGKFAYLTLSDPSGEFELFVAPEVLAETRDYFEVGNRVNVHVKVRRKDDELRFSVDGARPLDKAALGAPARLCVRVGDIASMEQLAEVAMKLREVSCQTIGTIQIEIPLEDQRLITLELDGHYPMDYAAMSALKSVVGVERVTPIAA
ncbi:DNA polymerase III subunit alpha [Hirschia maritima]|uniref:DNA polymerase III subunit alpha n=1 Tax=Hirschia maritima TaxID=1121961 RepID=UPI00037ED083|nr:DNA polymerase III subunit alpha [Hirschia maritima]